MYNLVKQQVLINRDIIVDEVASWNWVNETQTLVPCFQEESVKIPRNNIIEVSTIKRSQKVIFPSTRPVDHELFSDSIITNSGELVHLAFLVDFEPVS